MGDVLFFIEINHTLKIVGLGALMLGILAGSLGAFAVLRQQSLLGDAISHATLPGVGIAFLLTLSKDPVVLLLGAGIAGWIGTLIVMLITKMSRIKRDAALGIVLSVFFGFGLVLLTRIQKIPTANQAGLNKFLFGNAATLLEQDIATMSILSVVTLTALFLFWKEFKLLVFDHDFAHSIGFPVKRLDILLTTLIVVAIVTGLQTVGAVLMSAMLVAPGAAARQWTDRLGVMVILSACFGAVAGVAGAVTSSLIMNLPTGPTIVLYISAIVFFSLLFAPNRGIAWDWLRTGKHRRHIEATAMLKNLLLFSESYSDPFHPHDLAALRAIGRAGFNKTINELIRRGWVKHVDVKLWSLTPEGLREAKRLVEEDKTHDADTPV